VGITRTHSVSSSGDASGVGGSSSSGSLTKQQPHDQDPARQPLDAASTGIRRAATHAHGSTSSGTVTGVGGFSNNGSLQSSGP
jgi:hypothetical protein